MFDFLSQKFSSLFSHLSSKQTITSSLVDEICSTVKDSLLEADVPLAVANAFLSDVKAGIVGQQATAKLNPKEFIMKVVYDKLLNFLGGSENKSLFMFQSPAVVMMVGLQGSGKTTSLAKLAHYSNKMAKNPKKLRILLASVDFYRPAAIDQLAILARQDGIDFYRAQATSPIAAAQEIYEYSKQNQYDLLLLDTAGRLHVEGALLEELRSIDAFLRPRYKILVLDSMTGQESLNVAQAFEQGVGFTGALLTKMDSDTRGGAAFSFCYALKKPVLFVGVGEKKVDLEPFRPERIAQRMLGMGDILTLVEKANEKIKQNEQDRLYNAMMKGSLTLEDFASQLDMVTQLGSLTSIMKYLPGGMGMNVSSEMLEKGEREVKRFKALISSMNPRERKNPKILDSSRKKRIALGSGLKISDVDELLERFKQSQQMLKGLKQGGGFNRFFK